MSIKISDIEGIGPANAKKLAKCNIKSVNGLLKSCASKKGRRQAAKDSGLDEKKILKWVNMADLYRIKGVGSEYSELLEAAGVDTIKELRNRNVENLHAKMLEVNTKKKLVRQPPSVKFVEKWVAQAKKLKPMVSY
jgi:predicted flap endonuclease-1-like 5' DNA nuclease